MDRENIKITTNKKADLTQNSEGIYVNPQKAGIREAISNSITAVLKAVREEYINRDEGVIEINYNQNERYLIIRDNGIGMTEDTIRNVLSKLSESDTKGNSEMTGKFGIGFFSIFNLVGKDGLVQIYTKSRRDGHKGEYLCQRDSFYKVENVIDIPDKKKGYGTVIKIDIPMEADYENSITQWVKELSEYSRVPVLYKYINEQGKESHNEEYCSPTLKNNIDPKKGICITEDYYEVSISKNYNSNSKFIILDHPVEETLNKSLLDKDRIWQRNIEEIIRIKTEKRRVIEGENKGKFVVDPIDYNTLEENKKSNHIKESEVCDNDVVIPEPVGTRDKVSEEKEEFIDYLSSKLKNKINEDLNIDKEFDSVKEFISYFIKEADEEEFYRLIGRVNTPNKILGDLGDYNIDSDIVEFIEDMEEEGYKDHSNNNSVKNILNDITPENYNILGDSFLELILLKSKVNRSIYIGKTINNKKQAFIECKEPNSLIISVDTKYYPLLKEFGFKLLKKVNVNKDKLDDVKEFKKQLKKSEKINIHGSSAPRSPKKIEFNNLENYVENNEDKDIIFFVDHKISNYYNRGSRSCKLISVEDREVVEDIVDNNDNAVFMSNYIPDITGENKDNKTVNLKDIDLDDVIIKPKRSFRDVYKVDEIVEYYLSKNGYQDVILVDANDIEDIKSFYDFNISKNNINVMDLAIDKFCDTQESKEFAEDKLDAIRNLKRRDTKEMVEFLEKIIKEKQAKSKKKST